MDLRAWAALSIFSAVIAAIASGKVRATTATLAGATLMCITDLISEGQVIASIDHETVGLLVGMMIVVGILSKSGLFQYIAVMSIKITKGNGTLILWAISLITMVLSAFLDNVTTILLVTPVVLSLCDLIDMNPLPLLMIEAFSSTIGGTGTLIGDPPNMIIGSHAHFSFNDFLCIMTPVAIAVWGLTTYYLSRHFSTLLKFDREKATSRLADVDESRLIVNRPLMYKSLAVMSFVLVAFVLQRQIGIQPATSALTAAALLLIITSVDESIVIKEDIGWGTIIYFVSLFVMGGGLRATGVICEIAHLMTIAFRGSPLLMIMGILWVSGISCIFINSAAFAAIFVHVVAEIAQTTGMPPHPLYWALAMGTCLGGNGSFLGAAANAVMADLAVKNNIDISFGTFMRVGVKVVLIALTVASGALVIIWKAGV